MASSHTTRSTHWLTEPVESGGRAGFGVYLHVPFCAHRCGYCDFATYDDRSHLMGRYVAALRDDIARTVGGGPAPFADGLPADVPAASRLADVERWPAVTSIFVGGGTPTLLPADDLAGLVRLVHEELDVVPAAEVTVEANPETARPELFAALVDAGVTRVSMGAQSFAPHVLETLERRHSPERPLEAVAQARAAGIREVSLDLIYGTPGESAADWRASLEAAVAAGVDHLSGYALTIHANTPFGARVARGAMPAPDDDVQADRFATAREVLGAAGFEHYELSNWALGPQHRSSSGLPAPTRSRHNLLYWRHGDYLGLGVGAHGHLDGLRWWSHRSIERYLDAVDSGTSPAASAEALTSDERAAERLLLGLRLREGIHPADLPPIDPLALEDTMRLGLVETACGRLRTTDSGWFLLDEAVGRLL